MKNESFANAGKSLWLVEAIALHRHLTELTETLKQGIDKATKSGDMTALIRTIAYITAKVTGIAATLAGEGDDDRSIW
jgi:hypothetical protein